MKGITKMSVDELISERGKYSTLVDKLSKELWAILPTEHGKMQRVVRFKMEIDTANKEVAAIDRRLSRVARVAK